METEFIRGQMAENMKENGVIIKCMVPELSSGQTIENMSENMLMIKNKVMENSSGLTDAAIKATGT